MTLDEAIWECYRSAAVAYGAAKHKWDIAKVERRNAREIEKAPGQTAEQRRLTQAERVFWHHLLLACDWAMKYYSVGMAGSGSGEGLQENLYDAWLGLGNDPVDLPDWDYYANLPILQITTFSEPPPIKVRQLEQEFKEQPFKWPKDLHQKGIVLYDLLTDDLWRAEGMRRYLANRVDTSSAPAESVWFWETMQEGAERLFSHSTTCLTKMNKSMTFIDRHGGDVDNDTAGRIDQKYTFGGNNEFISAGGLFAINKSQLGFKWKRKVERSRIHYE